MAYALVAVLLAMTAFLIELNGMLRGRLRAHIDAALGATWILLLVLALILFGWRIALGGLVGSVVVGALLYPIARLLAGCLLPSKPGRGTR